MANAVMRRLRDKITSRWTALKSERSSLFVHWRDITRHLVPRSGRYFVQDRNKSGRYKYNAIYDSTGTRALRVLGAGMMAGATSPARPWFRMQTADPDLNDFHPVRLWLDDVVQRMQRVFQRSNTYRTLHNMYEELGAFGTSVSMMTSDFDRVIHHYPVPAGEYALAQDYQGNVSTLYREFEKPIHEVVEEFGKENVSKRVRDEFEKGHHLDAPVRILHAIEPRADREDSQADARNMPWRSIYIEASAEEDKVLRDSGFERFPVLAPRWAINSGDVYGHSPGMEALGDIRQLQQEQLRKGMAIDYQTMPPLQLPTSLKDRDREGFPGGRSFYDPGGMAFVDQVTPNGGIRSMFDVKLRLDYLLEDMRDVRERINRSFFADLFLMLASASPTARMTATEVAERHEEKLLMLGPTLERLHNELLEPLVNMTFLRMLEMEALPPPPPDLFGAELGVEFVSVLAQAQRAIGVNATDRFVGNMLALAEAKPDVLDKFNADAWVDHYSDSLGVAPQLIVSNENAQALREARARAEMAAQQSEMLAQQAKAAKDLSGAQTREPSALTDIMDQLTGFSTPSLSR